MLLCRYFCLLLLLCSIPFVGYAKTEIRMGLEGFPSVFNPILKSGTLHFSIGGQIFAGLTRMDENGEAVAYLAKDWNVSEDGLVYTFTIRENAKFHDNSAITIDDIIFSLETSKKHHPFFPFLEQIHSVSKVVDKDDIEKLQIHLKKPFERLPFLLIPVFVPIMPKHVYGVPEKPFKELASQRDVVGSGPYQIHSYKENEYIKLTKFPEFFLENQPKADVLHYSIFLDSEEMLYALGIQDIDIAPVYSVGQGERFFEQFSQRDFNSYILDNVDPYFVVLYNYKKRIFQNKKIRKAFSLALNRERFVKYFLTSVVSAMGGPIPKESPFYVDTPYEHSIEKANQLLDEAGYERNINGKRFSLTLKYFDYSPIHTSITHWLQNEFSTKLGIEVQTQSIKNIGEEEQLLSGDFDMVLAELFTWNEPLIALERLYSSKNTQKGLLWTNLGEYSNHKADKLFFEATQKETSKERIADYQALQHLLVEDDAALWLFSNQYSTLVNKNILHFDSLPYGMMSPFLKINKK